MPGQAGNAAQPNQGLRDVQSLADGDAGQDYGVLDFNAIFHFDMGTEHHIRPDFCIGADHRVWPDEDRALAVRPFIDHRCFGHPDLALDAFVLRQADPVGLIQYPHLGHVGSGHQACECLQVGAACVYAVERHAIRLWRCRLVCRSLCQADANVFPTGKGAQLGQHAQTQLGVSGPHLSVRAVAGLAEPHAMRGVIGVGQLHEIGHPARSIDQPDRQGCTAALGLHAQHDLQPFECIGGIGSQVQGQAQTPAFSFVENFPKTDGVGIGEQFDLFAADMRHLFHVHGQQRLASDRNECGHDSQVLQEAIVAGSQGHDICPPGDDRIAGRLGAQLRGLGRDSPQPTLQQHGQIKLLQTPKAHRGGCGQQRSGQVCGGGQLSRTHHHPGAQVGVLLGQPHNRIGVGHGKQNQ